MAVRRKSDFVTKKKTRRKTTAARAKKAPQNTKSSPNKKEKSLNRIKKEIYILHTKTDRKSHFDITGKIYLAI